MGGRGGASPRPPLHPGPKPRDAAEPGGQPQPQPRPSRGHRRQSPSGQGRDPGPPNQVSLLGEGEAKRRPGPLGSRDRSQGARPGIRGSPRRARAAVLLLR